MRAALKTERCNPSRQSRAAAQSGIPTVLAHHDERSLQARPHWTCASWRSCRRTAASPTWTWPTPWALSPSPCLIRVKRLEQAGYIAGYGAHLRLEKLGDTLTVFTEVTLADHRREDFARFEAAIREVDEMLECHLVSGGYDYLLRFLTRGVNHYQEVIEGLLERNIGIEKYFSYIVIKSPFVKTHCPIERLFPERAR